MNILLIVTGGIAVYKSVDLTSSLVKEGHNVKVVMTENARKFITDLPFQSITKNEVYTDTFEELNKAEIQHIDLVKWADKILIAPATANIIAKVANGIADDLASTMLLAVRDFTQVYFAPAMNTFMYENPITQGNIFKLMQLGFNFIEPAQGILACGDIGKGKFPEKEVILDAILEPRVLEGKKILITAGATKEYIDPIRYVSNPASGKMGISIAEEAANLGAEVYLITSANYKATNKNVKVIPIVSAADMFEEVKKLYPVCDVIIKSAAVSDYTPVITYDRKVKKQVGNIEIEFKRTDDILQYVGQRKKPHQIVIGFAAETNDVENYAKDKLRRKNLDYIVANDISKKGIGFESNDNEVMIIDKYENIERISKTSKRNIAKKILEKVY